KVEHEGEVLTVTVKQAQGPAPAHHGAPSGSPDTITPIFAFDLVLDLVFPAVGPDGVPGRGAEGRHAVGETRREVRRVDQAAPTFSFRVPARPLFVVIDPELAVLAETKLEAPGDMLRAQLARASTARGRMLAAPALGRLDDPPSTKALAASLADERE